MNAFESQVIAKVSSPPASRAAIPFGATDESFAEVIACVLRGEDVAVIVSNHAGVLNLLRDSRLYRWGSVSLSQKVFLGRDSATNRGSLRVLNAGTFDHDNRAVGLMLDRLYYEAGSNTSREAAFRVAPTTIKPSAEEQIRDLSARAKVDKAVIAKLEDNLQAQYERVDRLKARIRELDATIDPMRAFAESRLGQPACDPVDERVAESNVGDLVALNSTLDAQPFDAVAHVARFIDLQSHGAETGVALGQLLAELVIESKK